MARKADIETDLTLEIDGEHITPDKFLRGARSFFAILNEVTSEVYGSGIEWKVQVKSGSNLIGVVPQPGYDPAVIQRVTDAVSTGIAGMERAAERPQFFNDRALKGLRELAGIVGKPDKDDTKIRVWLKKSALELSAHAMVNVNDILKSEAEDYGSLEGKLQTLTERGSFHFVIYEPLWDEAIRCYVPESKIHEAHSAFGRRVEVYGTIKYRKDGKPVSIQVDEIHPFPDDDDLPSYKDVHGILQRAS